MDYTRSEAKAAAVVWYIHGLNQAVGRQPTTSGSSVNAVA